MSILGCPALQVSSKVSQGAQKGIPLSLMCRDPSKHVSTEKARNVGNFSPPDMSGQLPPCPETSSCVQDPAFFLSSPSLLCGETVPQQENIQVILAQTKGRRLRIFLTPLLCLKATGTQIGTPQSEEEVGRRCLSAEMPLEEHKNTPDSSG